jgi:hypothetical protein
MKHQSREMGSARDHAKTLDCAKYGVEKTLDCANYGVEN